MRSLRWPARPGIVVLVGTLVAGTVLAGCGELRAERQGRQLGDEICDVRGADDLEDAQRQLAQVERELDDLQRIVGRPVAEDVEDIEENLEDLVEHAVDGNDALLDQDVAVIQRNVEAIQRQLSGEARAAYDGIQQGLGDCDY